MQPQLISVQPQLILWCKPIIESNPTEVEGSERLELSWGCDNYCYKKSILVIGNQFLSQEINSSQKNLLSLVDLAM